MTGCGGMIGGGLPETLRVTATFCVAPLDPELDEIRTLPEYVPAASPAGLTETVIVAGAVAPNGLGESQPVPPEAVSVKAGPAGPVIARGWERGADPPI